ncbi:MAG: hypothetical protein CM1200mP10_15330 [Candidatus Neomarinimicrobiota bacterium]|nr:MAG: hypothetical protein CM1200mP10_15330 [Candidatus Neomarinimicrobiota bacterium]
MDPIVGHRLYSWLDGLSLPMVALNALIAFLGVFVSWNIDRAVKGYFALFLLLDTGIMGVFLPLGFFPFLCFLGSNVTAYVFPDWNVGRTAKRICGN